MATISEALTIAIGHHQAGRRQAAEQIYRQILAVDPRHVDAIHLLGVMAHEAGQHEVAIEYIRQAIRLNETECLFHRNLGGVYRAAGRLTEAIDCFRRVLELTPNDAEAHNDLGSALKEHGQFEEAVAAYRRALELTPDFAFAHNNLGNALKEQGKLEEAVTCLRRAIELKPDYAEAHDNLGNVLRGQKKPQEAVASYRRALELKPDDARVHNNLANALADQGKQDQAVACYRRALELEPDDARTHFNLGNAFKEQGKWDEAVACYCRALELKPDFASAYQNLALALTRQNRFDEAEMYYRKALAIMPDFADMHVNFAALLLANGRFIEGWQEHEWRWRRPGVQEPRVPQPRWTGDSLAGRAILLRNDLYLGDMIQFMRYAEPLKQQGARVIVECPRSLARLAARASGVDSVVIAGDSLPSFDTYLPMLSLPAVLGTSLDNIPTNIPYLAPDDESLAIWQRELSSEPGFKIGIAWQGDPSHLGSGRFFSPSQFEPIARVSGVRLYSLQFGLGREQLSDIAGRWTITDLGERLGDFHNTAAIMRNLDLVITCDSAPAHLAGALGVPVWVALEYVPDWRWLLVRDNSPWYPTMRLFRQSRAGEWQDVFERIRDKLVEVILDEGVANRLDGLGLSGSTRASS